MSSTLLAPMEGRYIRHQDVTPEEQKRARQEFLHIIDEINKSSKPLALCGKKTVSIRKTFNVDAGRMI